MTIVYNGEMWDSEEISHGSARIEIGVTDTRVSLSIGEWPNDVRLLTDATQFTVS